MKFIFLNSMFTIKLTQIEQTRVAEVVDDELKKFERRKKIINNSFENKNKIE